MRQKVKGVYDCIILFLISLLLLVNIWLLIKSLVSEGNIIGGFILYFTIIYRFLCVGSFYIINHGLLLYIIGISLILLGALLCKYLPKKEIVISIIICVTWYFINYSFKGYIMNTLSNTKSDLSTIATTVVTLSTTPEFIFLNILTGLSFMVFLVMFLLFVGRVLEQEGSKNAKETVCNS